MAKRPLRKTNRTVLIVVEGETEHSFVNHIKNTYYCRGMRLSIAIKNAHGHGPQGVISKLKSASLTANYDHRVAVLDADIPLTTQEQAWLRKGKVETILSIPAVEATLLAILGRNPPNATATCKAELQRHAPGDQTDIRYYQRHFPHAILEQARRRIQPLDAIIVVLSKE